jgi:hypothetical protein
MHQAAISTLGFHYLPFVPRTIPLRLVRGGGTVAATPRRRSDYLAPLSVCPSATSSGNGASELPQRPTPLLFFVAAALVLRRGIALTGPSSTVMKVSNRIFAIVRDLNNVTTIPRQHP